MNGMGIQL